MGISAFTGKHLSKPPFSNIHDHHQASGHLISLDDFPFSPLVLHPLNIQSLLKRKFTDLQT